MDETQEEEYINYELNTIRDSYFLTNDEMRIYEEAFPANEDVAEPEGPPDEHEPETNSNATYSNATFITNDEADLVAALTSNFTVPDANAILAYNYTNIPIPDAYPGSSLSIYDISYPLIDDGDNDNDSDSGFIPFTPEPPHRRHRQVIDCTTSANADPDIQDETETMCYICLEHCPEYQMVYLKEANFANGRCCMQNSMCQKCMLNTLQYKPNEIICCPFCRNTISHIETQHQTTTDAIKQQLDSLT